jgi:hypothetical protein
LIPIYVDEEENCANDGLANNGDKLLAHISAAGTDPWVVGDYNAQINAIDTYLSNNRGTYGGGYAYLAISNPSDYGSASGAVADMGTALRGLVTRHGISYQEHYLAPLGQSSGVQGSMSINADNSVDIDGQSFSH